MNLKSKEQELSSKWKEEKSVNEEIKELNLIFLNILLNLRMLKIIMT